MMKIAKTFFALFCGRGLMAFRQIVTVPILMKFWGVEYFGQWLVISAIPTFLAMSNLGLGSSAAVNIAMKIAADDKSAAAAILATAWTMLLIVIAIMLAGISMYLWYFGMSKESLPDSSTILFLLFCSIMVKMLSHPLTGWWNGNGLVSTSVNYWNVGVLGETIIAILVPILGGKALMLACATLAWAGIWTLFYFHKTRSQGCDLWRNDSFTPNRTLMRNLLATGVGHQLSPLWQGLYFQGSIMLASQMFGPLGAAAWGSVRIFTRAGNQILELLSQSLAPEFQRGFGTGQLEVCRKWHSFGILASFGFSLIVSILLLWPGKVIFDLWTHGQFQIPVSFWAIMCLCLIPFSLWQLSAEVQRSANKPWFLNLWGIIAACASLITMKLSSAHGMVSLAFGALLFETMMALFVLPVSCKLVQQRLTDLTSDAPAFWLTLVARSRAIAKKVL
jgi:O-antigen/teichoic acid export membrane protein